MIIGVSPIGLLAVPTSSWVPLILVIVQTITFAVLYELVFILQKLGGPVYLSLMGSVAAIIGIPIAVLLLGENVPEGLLIGPGLIAVGVAAVTYVGALNARRSRELVSSSIVQSPRLYME